jgi:hypothetical protein
MLNFDAPDRYYCVVSRQNTSTPLQALVLMNDPQFVEAARVIGEKMMETPSLDEAIDLAFRCLLSRKPRPEEKQNLNSLWQAVYADFVSGRSVSSKILSIGESIASPEKDKNQLAAHTIIASTLMNYDEFVMKR